MTPVFTLPALAKESDPSQPFSYIVESLDRHSALSQNTVGSARTELEFTSGLYEVRNYVNTTAQDTSNSAILSNNYVRC